jgi:hypothetical protein
MRRLGTATLLLLLACHRPLTAPVDPAKLSAAPSPLLLPDAYIGQSVSGTVNVTNSSLGAGALDLRVTSPFTVAPATLDVPGGGSAGATVHFTATQAGAFSGTLTLGPLTVPVQVNALAIPACPAAACTTASFDVTTGQCTGTPLTDGAACHTACVDGACMAGACKGTTTQSCDDGDACTVDACNDSTGCIHVPLACPEDAAHCQSATCDPSAGCMTAEAIDGTLCGPDDCLSTQVDVCIAGACVQRTRPPTGRCTNTWVPAYLGPRGETAVVYDAARKRVVLFGGTDPSGSHAMYDDTWEYDGTTWTYRTPATSPPARQFHAMAYDPLRQRTVLFGGSTGPFGPWVNDTWEYDGTTWVQRTPQHSPPERDAHALAYDTARARVVLYGGGTLNHPLDDTWEFDGTDWVQRTPAHTPAANNLGMAYDAVRRRTVLVAASTQDVWEWDGTDWSSHTPATDPGGRYGPGLAWDPVRQRVLLVGGLLSGHAQFDTWAWDGANWTPLQPQAIPPGIDALVAAYDTARQRLVVTGMDVNARMGTWELDAQAWHDDSGQHPAALVGPSLAYDDAHQRVVMFGGDSMWTGHTADTWEWDGVAWSLRNPEHAPPPRSGAAFAWDAALGRGVLFGGSNGLLPQLNDTWSWDGTSWVALTAGAMPPAADLAEAYDAAHGSIVAFGDATWSFAGAWHTVTPMTTPGGRSTALAYDEARSEVVLFGGQDASALYDDTWVWDGQTWTQRMPMSVPPKRRAHAIAYDSDRQVTVLFGGEGDLGDALDDMWEWDGSDWTQAMPARSPPPSEGHTLAYDAARHRLILAGSSGTWLYLP